MVSEVKDGDTVLIGLSRIYQRKTAADPTYSRRWLILAVVGARTRSWSVATYSRYGSDRQVNLVPPGPSNTAPAPNSATAIDRSHATNPEP
jgi:hypothetical protein